MFCLEIFFDRIYAILSQNLFSCLTCFDAIYALSMWRKIQPKFCPWRKNDKYHVCQSSYDSVTSNPELTTIKSLDTRMQRTEYGCQWVVWTAPAGGKGSSWTGSAGGGGKTSANVQKYKGGWVHTKSSLAGHQRRESRIWFEKLSIKRGEAKERQIYWSRMGLPRVMTSLHLPPAQLALLREYCEVKPSSFSSYSSSLSTPSSSFSSSSSWLIVR